jgi:hypothetical protein
MSATDQLMMMFGNLDEPAAEAALAQAGGDLNQAIDMIFSGQVRPLLCVLPRCPQTKFIPVTLISRLLLVRCV